MANSAHAANQCVAAQELLVRAADELPAAIRMQDHFAVAFPLPYRRLDGAHHHVPVLAMVHRPAHHPLAVQIQHDAQEQLALVRQDLGDVRDPFGLGLEGIEVTLEKILDADRTRAGLLAKPPLLPLRPALNPVGRHQPGDPVEAGGFALIAQVFVGARRAKNALAVFMHLTDTHQQARIVLRPRSGLRPDQA